MVQPHLAAGAPEGRGGLHGRVRAQGDELGGLVVRQPDLDGLGGVGQTGEPERARLPRRVLEGARAHVDGQGVAAGHAPLPGEPSVHEQVVEAVGARRHAYVDALGRHRVEFDDGGAGAEGEADAGGLRLGHGQLAVRVLGAGPGGEAVREEAASGALNVDRTVDEVVRQRCGGQLMVGIRGAHGGVNLLIKGVDDSPCRSRGGRAPVHACAGQLRSSASSASRLRSQLSPESGALWLNPPASSRLT